MSAACSQQKRAVDANSAMVLEYVCLYIVYV